MSGLKKTPKNHDPKAAWCDEAAQWVAQINGRSWLDEPELLRLELLLMNERRFCARVIEGGDCVVFDDAERLMGFLAGYLDGLRQLNREVAALWLAG